MNSRNSESQRRWLFGLPAVVLATFLSVTLAHASGSPQRCGGVDIANGPFAYSAASPNSALFDEASTDATSGFTVTAPSPNPNTAAPDVFPGQGQDRCLTLAHATFGVFDIIKIADRNNNPVNIDLDSSSALYQQIASQFVFNPSTHDFTVGQSFHVGVTIHNPHVEDDDYGKYMVLMKSQAPGAGIGTGPGATITLTFSGNSVTDHTPPVVTILEPLGNQILGVIPVEVTAVDPLPGTGVVSMNASVTSVGGTVNQSVAVSATLPVAAGVTATADGSFTPAGGTGPAGTTSALAFTSDNRSGVGNYTLHAQATDAAGNTGFAAANFQVKYAIDFTMTSVPPGCPGGPPSNPNYNGCHAMLKFLMNRSNITSDGAFMYDETIVLKLVRVSDNVVMATHVFGTGDPKDVVKLDAADTPNAEYHTMFRHDLAGLPDALGTYRVDIYVLDVDGNAMFQGSSDAISF